MQSLVWAVFMVTPLILMAADDADAFDGVRKGFNAGLGLGWAPYVHWSELAHDIDLSGDGVIFSLVAGYAWDNRNVILAETYGVLVERPSGEDHHSSDAFYGVLWYHSFKPASPSLYAGIGVGRLKYFGGTTCGDELGFAVRAEFGYEPLKQIQVSVVGLVGRTSHDDHPTNHQHIGFLAKVLAY
jgi:hypothetical protein